MGPIFSILAAFRRGEARRATARSLRGMSAAQLTDIGIPVDGIDDVVESMLSANEYGPAPSGRASPAGPSRPFVLVQSR